MAQHPHPGQVAGEGAHGGLQEDRVPGQGRVVEAPGLTQREREQRGHHGRHAQLVEQRFFGRHCGHSGGADRQRGQAPEHAGGQAHGVTDPLAGRRSV